MGIVILDNYVFMFQSNNADVKVIMQRYYGCDAEEKVAMKLYFSCCNYKGKRQIQVQQLQCPQGCHEQFPVPPPYSIKMVINQHYSPTSSDFDVSQTSQGIPTMRIHRDHRLSIIPIPQPPNTMDLKIVGATMITRPLCYNYQ